MMPAKKKKKKNSSVLTPSCGTEVSLKPKAWQAEQEQVQKAEALPATTAPSKHAGSHSLPVRIRPFESVGQKLALLPGRIRLAKTLRYTICSGPSVEECFRVWKWETGSGPAAFFSPEPGPMVPASGPDAFDQNLTRLSRSIRAGVFLLFFLCII